MPSINILLSDLKVGIQHKYDFITKFCNKYVADFNKPDINVVTDDTVVIKEKEMVPDADMGVCESLCIYRQIAEQLPQFDRFVFHGAAIECDGNAYVFTAPSGTGKTTHINLWKKNLGDRVGIINGDKPIIKVDKNIVVYGTPWAGKEGLHRNTRAPLGAICILKQGESNNITRLENSVAIKHLMQQVYLPQNPQSLSKTLELLGVIIEKIPVYMLECDISDEAFNASYNEITKR